MNKPVSECVVSIACLLGLASSCADSKSGQQTGATECDNAPPKVIMSSSAGEQVGGYGSACISCVNDNGNGSTVCSDGQTMTTGYSIVHPGDELTFSMPDGMFSDGMALLRIRNLGCSSAEKEALHEVEQDVPFTAELAPGRYLITFSADFEAGRKSGGMAAGFGLIVDPDAERSVVTDGKVEADCEE